MNNAVAFVLVRNGRVLMEQTPTDHKLYRGEWAIPSGRIEAGETSAYALHREMAEELTCEPMAFVALPALDCTGEGCERTFTVKPYLVHTWMGTPPKIGGDGACLAWRTVSEAMSSPIAQVRMMVAAALPASALVSSAYPS